MEVQMLMTTFKAKILAMAPMLLLKKESTSRHNKKWQSRFMIDIN